MEPFNTELLRLYDLVDCEISIQNPTEVLPPPSICSTLKLRIYATPAMIGDSLGTYTVRYQILDSIKN